MMDLKDKQAKLAVLILQAETLQAQIIQLKREVISEMNNPFSKKIKENKNKKEGVK